MNVINTHTCIVQRIACNADDWICFLDQISYASNFSKSSYLYQKSVLFNFCSI